MHIAEKTLIEVLAQEWYVVVTFAATFILFEIRKYGESLAMHHLLRHALWAAASVVVVQASVFAAVSVRKDGLSFAIVDTTSSTLLTGSVMFLLGRMFERVPKPAVASKKATYKRF